MRRQEIESLVSAAARASGELFEMWMRRRWNGDDLTDRQFQRFDTWSRLFALFRDMNARRGDRPIDGRRDRALGRAAAWVLEEAVPLRVLLGPPVWWGGRRSRAQNDNQRRLVVLQ